MLFDLKKLFASNRMYVTANWSNGIGGPLIATYEEAYHQLMLDIMKGQIKSTRLILEGSDVKRIFVDGGFSKNPIYMNLLAKAFPEIEVYAAFVAQATALGAALAIHKYWNKKPVPSNIIELMYYHVTE